MNIMYGVEITAVEFEKLKDDLGFEPPSVKITDSSYANHQVISVESKLMEHLVTSETDDILSFEVGYDPRGKESSPSNRFAIVVKSTVMTDLLEHMEMDREFLFSEDKINPSVKECAILDDFIRKHELSKNPQLLIVI